jgi:DNA-binding transcriptional ArsR family regulator
MTTSKPDATFDALANEHRRAILHALSLQPRSISELAEDSGLSLQAIHRHIGILEDAGLVARRKSGRTNFLALQRTPLRILQEWVQGFNPHWGDDRESLDNYIDHINQQPTTTEEPKRRSSSSPITTTGPSPPKRLWMPGWDGLRRSARASSTAAIRSVPARSHEWWPEGSVIRGFARYRLHDRECGEHGCRNQAS